MQVNKIIIGIIVLVLIAGAGYWFVQPTPEVMKDTSSELQNLPIGDSTIKTPEKATEDKPIINQIENKKIMTATLHTNKGDITIEFNSATPETVANFTKLAQAGFYDGTKFHRIIKGFMSQGGDPLSKDDTKADFWGTGGPGYKFNDEITPANHNNLGTIAMANSGPNTNGSQFFINAGNNNFLDTKHTVFGTVTAGLDVALAINSVATGPNDRPLEPVILQSITLK